MSLHPISSVSAFLGARAKDTDGQTLTTATLTAVNLDGEDYDTGGFHDNATNNTRLTVPVGQGGYYAIKGQVVFSTDNVGVRLARLRIDGATAIATAIAQPVTAETTQVQVTADYSLAAGQYVELIAYHTKGTDLTLTAGSWLTIAKLAA